MVRKLQGLQLPTYHCLRCSQDWVPRKSEYPRRCGKCGSPYWDVEKVVGK